MMTDFTESRDLYLGLFNDKGVEPRQAPYYRRRQIAMRWDRDSDEEVYTNVGIVQFSALAQDAGTATHLGLFAGEYEQACLIVCVPLKVSQLVISGCTMAVKPGDLRVRRAELVELHGGTHVSFPVYRDVSLTDYQMRMGVHNRSLFTTIDLEFKPRPVAAERPRVLDDLAENARAMDAVAGTSNPLADLFKQRYGNYAGPAKIVPDSYVKPGNMYGLPNGEFHVSPQDFATMADKCGIDPATKAQWVGSVREKLDGSPLSRESLREFAENLAKNAYDKILKDKGIIFPPTTPPVTAPERKVIVQVPKFWGQLSDAMQQPREAKPLAETMPQVEASPAGAEELIDWLRAQPDHGWAERLSIPRVTRMLKEREQFGMAYCEKDVRGTL